MIPSTAQETRVDRKRLTDALKALQHDQQAIAYQIRAEMVDGVEVDGIDFDHEQIGAIEQALMDAVQESVNRLSKAIVPPADTGDRITSDNQNAVDRQSEGNLASRSAAPQVEQEKREAFFGGWTAACYVAGMYSVEEAWQSYAAHKAGLPVVGRVAGAWKQVTHPAPESTDTTSRSTSDAPGAPQEPETNGKD
jgi:hypothetical protein